MQTGTDRVDGLERRVLGNIRFNARRLARRRTVPGMTLEDYEQDLVLDLLRREGAYDSARGAFTTFADRIVGHRASALARPTVRIVEERRTVSLDAPVIDPDGRKVTLADLLSDEAPPLDDGVLIGIDVPRFVETLPESLAVGCEVLLADSITEGARAAGIHRSAVYERLKQLREAATLHGLDIYFAGVTDSSPSRSVCGGYGVRRPAGVSPDTMSMTERIKPPRVSLLVGEEELRGWLADGSGGDTLEYHRGVLGVDRMRPGSRLPDGDRRELDRIARSVLALAEAGRGHLLQRRHGNGDYSYLFVLRPISAHAKNGLTALPEDVS